MVEFAIDVVVDPSKSNRGIKQVENNLEGLNKSADRTGQLLSRAFAGIGGIYIAQRLGQMADTWSDLSARVKIATGSQEAATVVMDRLSQMARRTYSSLQLTAESYLLNSNALKELGYSTNQSLDFVEAINNALVVSGAKGQRAESVMNALSKSMALGKLSGDNLNTVLASGGRIAEVIASSMGVTTTQLRSLGEQGKITGDVIYRSLVSNLGLLREQADGMPATIGDAFTLLQNSVLTAVGSFDKAHGISLALSSAIISLADNLDIVGKAAIITASAFGALAAVNLVTSIMASAKAVGVLNLALALGPGSLIVILGAVAGAAYVFKKELEASIIAGAAEAIIVVDKLVESLSRLQKYTTNGLGALYAKAAAKLGLVDEAAVDQEISGLSNTGSNLTGLTAEEIRQSRDEMINKLSSNDNSPLSVFPGLDISPIKAAVGPTNEALKETQKILERQKNLLEDIKGPQFNYKQNVEDLGALLNQGKISQEEYTKALRGFDLQALSTSTSLEGGLKRGLLSLKDSFTDVASVAEDLVTNAFKSAEDALVNFVRTGKLNFSDLIDSMLSDLARLYIRQSITGPLASALTDFTSSGSGGGFLSDLGSLFGFANGGSFQVGGSGGTDSQLVAFKASPDETVTVTRPDQSMGSSPVIVNIINNTSSQVEVKQSKDGSSQSIEVMIDQAVAKNINSNSSKTNRALKQYSNQGMIRR